MIDKIQAILEDIRSGKPIILVDDYDREFEGDLVIAAEKVTVENLCFSMLHARGLMCLPCLQETCDRLQIPMFVTNKNDKFGTPFTVSVDAVEGTTTGMSVYDRLKTISVLLDESSTPNQLAYPGHMFPLRAKSGLLMDRRGHTEGSLELMKLAGMKNLAVIIEIMNYDGTMIKGKNLETFSNMYNLQLISIDEISNHVYGKSI